MSHTHALAKFATPCLLRSRRPRARRAGSRTPTRASSTQEAGETGDDLAHQWMALNYRPWVKSEADAAKCLAHLRATEGRVFDLEKAKVVLESIKADHMKYTPKIPFALPKTYPGFLLILERSSDKVD